MPQLSPRAIALSGLLLIALTGAATRLVEANQACGEACSETSRKKHAAGLGLRLTAASGRTLRTRHETQKAIISNLR